MKKILFVVAVVATLTYVGCKKKTIETTPLGTATITGRIFANLDLSNDTNAVGSWEAGTTPDPVAGMRVYTTINFLYLDQTPNGNTSQYKEKTYETTTDANGRYTLSLPAGDRSFTVTIRFESFEADKVLSDAFGSVIGVEQYTFSGGNENATIYDGATITKENKYLSEASNNSNPPNATGTYSLSGTVYAERTILAQDTTGAGADTTVFEFVPEGTELTIRVGTYISGDAIYEYLTVIIGANGVYSVNIPTDEAPLGTSSYRIYFPEFTANFQDDRSLPSVNESRIFEEQSYANTYYSGTATNGKTDVDVDFFYFVK